MIEHYKKVFQKAIDKMNEDKEFVFNIRETFPELSPSSVEEILGELEWQRNDFYSNGWKQDTYCDFYNEIFPFKLIMYYSGFFWDLDFSREDVE